MRTSGAGPASGIDLIVTDLDGTLWETPRTIHRDVLAAVGELERRGYPLLVATGRRLRSTREPLAALDLAPPAVVFNGALSVDLGSGEHLHRQPFTPAAAVAVLDAFLDAGVSPCVYVEDGDVEVCVGTAPDTHPDHLVGLRPWVRTADLAEVVAEVPVFAFGVLGNPVERLHAVAAGIGDVASVYVAPDREHGDATIMVNPGGLSKWVGVEAYCRRTGVDPGRVAVLGDGPNDVELLARAAVALVPADGHPDALARADRVIGRAVDGGWAEVLDLLP